MDRGEWSFLTSAEYRSFEEIFESGDFHGLVKKYPHHVELFWVQFITTSENMTKDNFKLFIDRSIDVNKKFEFTGVYNPAITTLEYACEYRNTDLMNLLFDANAVGSSKLIDIVLYGHSALNIRNNDGCDGAIKLLDEKKILRIISKATFDEVYPIYKNNTYLKQYLQSCSRFD
jgi:hypothetical protein